MTRAPVAWKALFAGVLCFFLTSCSLPAISSDEDAAMKQVFELVRSGDKDAFDRDLSPILRAQSSDALFARMAGAVPKSQPLSVKRLSTFVGSQNSGVVGAVYEYRYPTGVMFVSETIHLGIDGLPIIYSFNIRVLTNAELARSGALDLVGKMPIHYLVLVLAAASVSTILYGLVVLFKAKDVRRKWLWAVGMVWGVTGVSVNWTTGQLIFQIIDIQLFGISAVRGFEGAPWMVGASLPLVAILFLTRGATIRTRRSVSMLSLSE